MITQYKFKLAASTEYIQPNLAYRLYAWLLDCLSSEEAEKFHAPETSCLNQYICRDVWTVSLLGETAVNTFGEILENVAEIELDVCKLQLDKLSVETISDAETLLLLGQKHAHSLTRLDFRSPTSFKSGGRYMIYPREELLIQSLVNRWNECFPEYTLSDDEALAELQSGIHIVDYRLRTCRYRLKGASIPAFVGNIMIEAKLPLVLRDVWNSLLCFSEYRGVGIKTTLGMGGAEIIPTDESSYK